MDMGRVIDIIYFDVSYTVGTVPHSVLVWKEGEVSQQTQPTGEWEEVKYTSEGEWHHR